MKKYIAGTILALAAMFCLCTPVLAEEAKSEDNNPNGSTLRLTPTGTRIKLTAGETLEGKADGCRYSSNSCSFQVSNEGTKKFRYKVSFSPYTIVDGDNNFKPSDGENPNFTQLSRWLAVRNSDGEYVPEATFTIEPGTTQEINYRVKIPDDLPGGSQFAMMWVQILSDEQKQSSGVQALGQIGAIIIGRTTGETNESVEIDNLKMTRFSLGGTLTATGRLKNTGNTDLTINYSYSIRSFFGKELFSKSDQTLAYPGIEYTPKVTWDKAPLIGIYRADFTISAGSETKTSHHLVLIMPLFAIILLILLLTALGGWIIIIIRKRKERKARKLI